MIFVIKCPYDVQIHPVNESFSKSMTLEDLRFVFVPPGNIVTFKALLKFKV